MNRVLTLIALVGVVALVAGVVSITGGAGNYVQAGEEEPGYIAAKGCKKCHFKQHKDWKKSNLAKSFNHLKAGESADAKKAGGMDPNKDYTKDPSCLKCHTTGYGTKTGYPAVVEGKAWTEEETARAAKFEGVQCEACHGPGSLYSKYKKGNKEFKRADIAKLGAHSPLKAEHCTKCHNAENPNMKEGEVFDFATQKKSEAMHRHQKLKYDHK